MLKTIITSPEFQKSLVAVGSAGFTLASNWIVKEIKSRRKEKAARAIQDMGAVYDVLNSLGALLGADRSLVLYTANGGGIPSATKTVNTTILYETIRGEGLQSIRMDWQNMPIDQGYVEMLRKVIDFGYFTGTPSDLKEGSLLRTLYNDEGVKRFWVQEIYRSEKKYFYISVRWCEHTPPPDENIKKEIAIAATKIKHILKASEE